jgi:Mn-dependent DtxR family transcriptional regulator
MRQHNGMRPQDVVILLKIITKKDRPWQNKDLAGELFISPAEVSDSLSRSEVAGLIDASKKIVFRQSLMEFLEHGLCFPCTSGHNG